MSNVDVVNVKGLSVETIDGLAGPVRPKLESNQG
jgi:hypothetical protein